MKEVCAIKAEAVCKSYPRCNGCNAHRKRTRYNLIRDMGVDELAEKIFHAVSNCTQYCAFTKDGKCDNYMSNLKGTCTEGIKKWLESEVE